MQEIIKIENGVCRMPAWRMAEPVNFILGDGEHIAIVGPNGAGKTMLTDIITGAHVLMPLNEAKYDFRPSKSPLKSDNIKLMTFRDSYGTADGTYYYQQRWNQTDIDETPIVGDILHEVQQEDDTEMNRMRERLYEMFNLHELLEKHVILLSSGEMRKFQLTKTLLTNPRVLILDNPFIGLDVNARQQLHDFLTVLAKETKVSIILVQSKTDDIPEFITHVYEVKDMRVGSKQTRQEYMEGQTAVPQQVLSEEKRQSIINLDSEQLCPDGMIRRATYEGDAPVIDFRHVTIRYGERTILNDLNLTINTGERWALGGENGAGKSTLLSIVCADNPQAYANDIVLFGHQRGHGESIWDIKRHIGYISPEMHRAFQRDLPAMHIVASGMSDMNGLYQKPKPEYMAQCRFWMDVFGVGDLADRTFLKLSSGEQRLVLLARAFVKDPSLLILDEPLHGLDNDNRQMVKDIIEAFCQRPGKTLIMVSHYKEEFPPCMDHEIFLRKINK